jgi:hypothetical protein
MGSGGGPERASSSAEVAGGRRQWCGRIRRCGGCGGGERRWGVRWSMGSKGSDCAKGVSSRMAAAGSAQAGGANTFMVREIRFRSGDW